MCFFWSFDGVSCSSCYIKEIWEFFLQFIDKIYVFSWSFEKVVFIFDEMSNFLTKYIFLWYLDKNGVFFEILGWNARVFCNFGRNPRFFRDPYKKLASLPRSFDEICVFFAIFIFFNEKNVSIGKLNLETVKMELFFVFRIDEIELNYTLVLSPFLCKFKIKHYFSEDMRLLLMKIIQKIIDDFFFKAFTIEIRADEK